MDKERTEALWRVLIGIVAGIILHVWGQVIMIVALVHWVIVLITGKRNRDLAKFANMYNTQIYKFVRYMTFCTNTQVFPFMPIGKDLEKVDMKS